MGPILFLAGGEGFEPPLAESESAVLPLDDPPKGVAIERLRILPDGQRIAVVRLALGVLRRASRFAQPDFLAFNFSSVTGHESGASQRGSQ